jgi:hypothetical protein
MAVVDQDTLWLDPTCKHCTFGDVPSADEDCDVLVVGDFGGVMVRTPASRADDNLVVRTTILRVDERDRLSVDSRQTVSGNYATYLRGWLPSQSPERVARFVLERFPGGEKEYRLLSHRIVGLDDPDALLTIELTAERMKRLDRIGTALYVAPLVFVESGGIERVSLKDRRVPLNTYYPNAELDTVLITWDEALAVDSVILPPPVSYGSDIGSIALSSSAGGSSAGVVVFNTSRAYEVAVGQFDMFGAYCEELRGALKRHVKLVAAGE